MVIPSIPGYALSGPTRAAGWDVPRVAAAWKELMRSLGYTRYLVQGGDWGSPISLRLGLADPEHIAGVHLNMYVTFPPDDPGAVAALDEADAARLAFAGYFQQDAWAGRRSSPPARKPSPTG